MSAATVPPAKSDFCTGLPGPAQLWQGVCSIPPGVYVRLLIVGYFEKLDSERQVAWRCDDSRSWRAFLGIAENKAPPDRTNLSRMRQRIDLETHRQVCGWVLKRTAERDLLKGKTLRVDATTMVHPRIRQADGRDKARPPHGARAAID